PTGPRLREYALLSLVDQKRLKCATLFTTYASSSCVLLLSSFPNRQVRKLFTTYAYDFLHMFEIAISAAWEKAPAACGTPPQ
mgnify:CR=1